VRGAAFRLLGPPKVVSLTLDLNGPAPRARGNSEDFIDVECIAVSSVLSLQSSGVYRTKLDAPQADCLSADGNTSLCQEVLDIATTVTTRLRLNR
jgi:hypothetical protein